MGLAAPHTVTHLLAGKAEPFRGEEASAICKRPLEGKVHITKLGLAGDEQADRKVHGGPDMAVHQYPLDHHDFWRDYMGDEMGEHDLLADPGAFGSNIALRGLTETDVHVGDRFRLGTALLEISQPRQPCWKIEHRFAHKGMVAAILKNGNCGWYYRVIEEGEAQAGDALVREVAGGELFRVDKVFSTLWGNPKAASENYLASLADLKALTPKLRKKIAEIIGN